MELSFSPLSDVTRISLVLLSVGPSFALSVQDAIKREIKESINKGNLLEFIVTISANRKAVLPLYKPRNL